MRDGLFGKDLALLTAGRFVTRVLKMLGIRWGMHMLDCVQMPPQLAHVPAERARRRVPNPQVSAW